MKYSFVLLSTDCSLACEKQDNKELIWSQLFEITLFPPMKFKYSEHSWEKCKKQEMLYISVLRNNKLEKSCLAGIFRVSFAVFWSQLEMFLKIWFVIPALVAQSLWTYLLFMFSCPSRMVHKWPFIAGPPACMSLDCFDSSFQALNPSFVCTRQVPVWGFAWIFLYLSFNIHVGSLTGPQNWFVWVEMHWAGWDISELPWLGIASWGEGMVPWVKIILSGIHRAL